MRGWRIAIVILGVAPEAAASGGKLDAVRSEVSGDSGSSSSSSSSSSGSGWSVSFFDSDSDDDGDDNGDVVEHEHHHDDADLPRFSRYPYVDGKHGYVVRERNEAGRIWSGRATLEGGYMGDRVWRSGLALRIAWWRFGLESDLHFYLEQPLRDALYLGTTNLTFDVAMNPHVLWRVGGGANYMIDGRTPGGGHREYASGFNFTTGLDVFPVRPLVFSARLDYGTLYKATVLDVRTTLGFVLSGVELFGGYEYKAIGKVPLHGPIAGVRLWF